MVQDTFMSIIGSVLSTCIRINETILFTKGETGSGKEEEVEPMEVAAGIYVCHNPS